MTFFCSPIIIIFLPCQRQHSFLLGNYFDFCCCSSEKYIHVTTTWSFSVFGWFRSVSLGNRLLESWIQEVYWIVISGITPVRGGDEEIGQRVIEWPCSHTVRLTSGGVWELGYPFGMSSFEWRPRASLLCLTWTNRAFWLILRGSEAALFGQRHFLGGVRPGAGSIQHSWEGREWRSWSWKGSVGLTSTAIHPLSHSDLLTSPGNGFSGTLVGLFFWGNFQRNVSGMN